MKVAIIEDEPEVAQDLKNLLTKVKPQIEVKAILGSVKQSIDWLSKNAVDLLFMDINLGKGVAFEIFEQIKIQTPIIFTTAYDNFTLQAFKVNSIDYLLKPIDQQELSKSLDKYEQLHPSQPKIEWKGIWDNLQNKPSKEYQTRLMVVSGEKILSIKVEDVAYFVGHQRYVSLVNFKNEHYLVDFTLEKLEEILNPRDFFRINRQFIVSFNAIKNMYAYLRGRIKLEIVPPTKEETIISSERAGHFKEWLNR
ncbi:MAG: LytTR family DNA-binding domain-containing protein [Microscillaceae bacterium]|jgi:DNA-binding LytR/AlgR family response regulator|nr:LytTR family DNA-binding domain-containing protein [Microscillaceae bacterium]